MIERLIWIAAVFAGILFSGCRQEDADEFVRRMNLGKAYLENRESAAAIEHFKVAIQLRGDSVAALRNLARANLIGKEREAATEAMAALLRAAEVESNSAATSYLMGLALTRLERYEEAAKRFEEAVRLDASVATLRYQLGRAYEHAGSQETAFQQFSEAVRLDPLHASAHYRLAAHARQRGDMDETRRLTAEFQRLVDLVGRLPEQALEACVYTQPELPPAPAGKPALGIPVTWVERSDNAFAGEEDRVASAVAVIDIDDAGRPIVFAVGPDGSWRLLSHSSDESFAKIGTGQLEGASGPIRCAVAGDFFIRVTQQTKSAAKHDSLNDVLVVGPEGGRLLERTSANELIDRTDAWGLAGIGGERAAWVDYDHDGDLDLLIAGQDGVQLWQNNGQFDGSESVGGEARRAGFVEVTKEAGIAATAPAWDVSGMELDRFMATDFVAGLGESTTRIFVNQRAGRFAELAEPPGPWPAARRVLVNDLNNDGFDDAVLVGESAINVVLGGDGGRLRLDGAGLSWAGAALIDFDNDGWLDVLAYGVREDGRGMARLWRNSAGSDWLDVSGATGLSAVWTFPAREAVVGDFDGDGDSDLLVVGDDERLRFIRNDGGNANRQLKIDLVSVLTNPSGFGTRVELRSGTFSVSRSLRQMPFEIGIGPRDSLDSIQLTWTNGVVDNETSVVVSSKPVSLIEKIVEAGSCGFLFAWDGERFRFVTDLLGNAPVGLSLKRGVTLPADLDEYVYVGTDRDLQPRDGYFELEAAECYREVLYLDTVALVAVDHDAGTEVHSTDKIASPPFPESELWLLKNGRVAHRVMGDDGIDRTAAVSAMDGDFAPPGDPLPPPHRGTCRPLSLMMDFGAIDTDGPLVLALTGWLRYGSASVNIGLSQNPSLSVIPPRLEVETDADTWQVVDVEVGMPAGKTKTILCDLSGKLPTGARRLRLTTTFEIRWDRIALFERAMQEEARVHELALASAELDWLGFPAMASRGAQQPITPDFYDRSDTPPWRTSLQGWCTRYGDVATLLAKRDDRWVLLNAGDSVRLRFRSNGLPPRDAHQLRTYFFYSVGLDKDGDYNVEGGDHVEPWPRANPGAEWEAEFNTRWVPSSPIGPAHHRSWN